MREPNWTKRELAILKKLYESGVPLQKIAAELNRSLAAVRGRAQIEGFRRPNRMGHREISDLRSRAIACGLDEAHLLKCPTSLKILVHLANADIAAKHDLDELCLMGTSARNLAIQDLKESGLVLVDIFSRPSEIVLTRRAYKTRTEPSFVDLAAVRDGILPTLDELTDALESWTVANCHNPESVDRYGEFIVRQLINAQSGDITHAAFYSIFFDFERMKAEEPEANDSD